MAVAGLADVAKGAVGPLLAGPDRPLLVGPGRWRRGVRPQLVGVPARRRGPGPLAGASAALSVRHRPGSAALLAGLGLGRLAGQTGLGCFVAVVVLVPVLHRTGGRRAAAAGRRRGSSPCWPSGRWATVPVGRDLSTYRNRPPVRTWSLNLARVVLDRDTWPEVAR